MPGLISVAFWMNAAPALWVQLVVVGLWLGLVIGAAEALNHYRLAEPEIVRKLVHIGISNVIVLAWWLHISTALGVIASLIFSGVALASYHFPILPGINSVGRQSLGTFFYALSFAGLIAVLWPSYPYLAVLGVLIMGWGDGLAAVVGQQWGRHPYKLAGMQKSWEGSLTMAIASFAVSGIILLPVLGNSITTWLIAGIVAIVATGLETFSKYGIDNLTVPLGSAAIAFWLIQLWSA